jgi:endonuclease/exonuclease/phosphatase family metal-dependent hydrolase
VANFHGSTRPALAAAELERLCTLALAWAGDAPLVLGGDLNLRSHELVLPAGVVHVACRDVDHLLAHGLEAVGNAQRLQREAAVDGIAVQLSDHVPLAVSLRARTGG